MDGNTRVQVGATCIVAGLGFALTQSPPANASNSTIFWAVTIALLVAGLALLIWVPFPKPQVRRYNRAKIEALRGVARDLQNALPDKITKETLDRLKSVREDFQGEEEIAALIEDMEYPAIELWVDHHVVPLNAEEERERRRLRRALSKACKQALLATSKHVIYDHAEGP